MGEVKKSGELGIGKLYISAYLSGVICSFLAIKNISFALAAGLVGIILASPLLLFVFTPWFVSKEYNQSFLVWSVLPTLSSLVYGALSYYLPDDNYFSWDSFIRASLLYASTGFVTSICMWFWYHKKDEDFKENIKANLLSENENASN